MGGNKSVTSSMNPSPCNDLDTPLQDHWSRSFTTKSSICLCNSPTSGTLAQRGAAAASVCNCTDLRSTSSTSVTQTSFCSRILFMTSSAWTTRRLTRLMKVRGISRVDWSRPQPAMSVSKLCSSTTASTVTTSEERLTPQKGYMVESQLRSPCPLRKMSLWNVLNLIFLLTLRRRTILGRGLRMIWPNHWTHPSDSTQYVTWDYDWPGDKICIKKNALPPDAEATKISRIEVTLEPQWLTTDYDSSRQEGVDFVVFFIKMNELQIK